MRHVAAYLLSVLGGKTDPSAADIEKVLSSVGIESDSDKLKTVIAELNGKNIEELIAKGKESLASMPAGGAAVAAAAAPAAAPAASPEKKEEKETKKEVVEEDSDEDMGFGLFD